MNSSPVAVVENASSSSITVRLETDVGESYAVGTIAPSTVTGVRVTGRDKLLWAVAEFPGGRIIQSKRLYTTTQGTLTVRITDKAAELTYVL